MANQKNSRETLDQEYRTAEHYFTRGNAGRALPHYRRALLADPDSYPCRLRVAQCLDRVGKLDESYEAFSMMMRQGIGRCEEPVQREILQAFTNLCHRLGRELEVIDCLNLHLPLIERTPALFYNLGLAFYKCQRFSEAKENFSKLKAIHPQNAAGYIGQAVLYCHFGQLENAVKELQAGWSSAPNDVQIVENLSVVQMKMGSPLAAVTTLRRALSKGFTQSPKIFHLLGMAHLRLGELSRAENFLRKSLELERTSEALREMGWLMVAKGDYPASIGFLKEALILNPQDIWAKVDLAIAYFKQGITADAQILFNEARAASTAPEINRLLDDLARVMANNQRT